MAQTPARTLTPIPSPDYENSSWDPVIIAMVGVACTIFLVFSYLKFLHRYCVSENRAQLQNEEEEDPSLHFQSRGMDSYLIHSLPITQFKNKNGEGFNQNQNKNTDCPVCLGEFEEGEWLKHLPNCRHVFHVSCINIWFQTHSNCPVCRSNAFDLGTGYECSVSVYALLQTLRREDFHQERLERHQPLPSHILRNSQI